MKNIVIFGAPGSGKGTQSDKLIEKYGLEHISTGDVLRAEIKNGTELGKTAKQFIDNGQLIPDELMVNILASVYDAFGRDHEGVIFDGFPRTIPQAEALKAMLCERGDCVAAMLELDELETGSASSLLDSGAPSQLLEEGALQLQGAALGLSLSQASIANARSDAAESPALLMNVFFMKPLLFL